MSSETLSAKNSAFAQEAQQGLQKATVFFCIFTTVLLCALSWLMTQINHSPWGLIGAAIIVAVLTGQQLIRKPATVAVPLKSARGTSLSADGV